MAKAKKVAFGGYAINFKGCTDSLEDIMGPKPIGPSEMTKKIWVRLPDLGRIVLTLPGAFRTLRLRD